MAAAGGCLEMIRVRGPADGRAVSPTEARAGIRPFALYLELGGDDAAEGVGLPRQLRGTP